jgi:hypothetical protein
MIFGAKLTISQQRSWSGSIRLKNERLTACGEFWQLDAKTRAMLGLPPRSNSPNNGKSPATIG